MCTAKGIQYLYLHDKQFELLKYGTTFVVRSSYKTTKDTFVVYLVSEEFPTSYYKCRRLFPNELEGDSKIITVYVDIQITVIIAD